MERITDWLTALATARKERAIDRNCAAVFSLPRHFGWARFVWPATWVLSCASRVFPSGGRQQVDLAAAPRRLLVATLQLAIVIAVGVPLIAITQPFLPRFIGPLVLLFVVVLLAISFWKNATNLQGHARAGAQAIIDKLVQQMHSPPAETVAPGTAEFDELMAGLGSPAPIEVGTSNPYVGKTLAEINLRGLTGATVLAIRRGGNSVLVPAGSDRLQIGDILAIAGTRESQLAAQSLFKRQS